MNSIKERIENLENKINAINDSQVNIGTHKQYIQQLQDRLNRLEISIKKSVGLSDEELGIGPVVKK